MEGKGRPVLITELSRKETLKLPSTVLPCPLAKTESLVSNLCGQDYTQGGKPQKRLTVDSWQRLLPSSQSLLEESAALCQNGRHCLFNAWLVPLANQAPPQSSVPWHAGALCTPDPFCLSRGLSCLPLNSSWGPGLLSQRHILSTHSRDAPVHTAGCVLLTPRSWSPNFRAGTAAHAARSSPWMPGKRGEPPTQRKMPLSVPNLCPLPCSLLEVSAALPPHLSVQKIPVYPVDFTT